MQAGGVVGAWDGGAGADGRHAGLLLVLFGGLFGWLVVVKYEK